MAIKNYGLKGFGNHYIEFYLEEIKEINRCLKQRFDLYTDKDIKLNRIAIKSHIIEARKWEQELIKGSLKSNKDIKIELSEKRFILNGKMWYVI